jgi:serine/threonine-protein kinase
MGAVYEGMQTRLERRVAVKLMARELSANPEAIARFRREAEVTSQIGHPHIVQVFDFGQAPGGEPYIVMEYLEGEDLEKRIQRVGQLPLAAASHIVRQVSSALSATHAKGIVHRDLKPANIFLLAVEGETDFVKVVDFGISKVRSATTKLTAALAVMGTPNYMAPEQAAGRVADIDPRTDQWALACIAYELVAGRPPFIGEDVASLLYQVIHQAPSPLAAFNPGLPSGVEGVLQRALSKTQADRFPTLTEFSRAFEGAAAGRPVPVTVGAVAKAPTAVGPAAAAAGASITTFSGAAGEAGDHGETLRVRPKRAWWLLGAGAAAAIGVGAFAVVSRRAPAPAAPAAGPAATGAVVAPPPREPAVPAAGAVDAGGGQVAAAPPPPPAPTKKRRAPRPAWPPPPGAPPPAAAAPTATQEPAPAPAAAPAPAWPSREAPPQQPAWPPHQPSSAGAAPAQQPAWPPPPSSQPDQQPKKKRGLFRNLKQKIFE